jgi:hypothetical protein
VLALTYSLGIAKSEDAIRLTGLLLQLAGILTVVWGLVATWRFFGLGDPVARVTDWLSRFPLRRRAIYASINEAVEADDALAARGFTSWPLDSTASLTDRLGAIEKNLPLIQERISYTQQELDRAVHTLRGELKEALAAANARVAHVDTKVTALGTGSLHISAMGALWLFVGSILGSASPNLAAWLK